MESNKFNLKVMYHKFFVFLPALIVIMLILMIYVSYWVSYIIPLLQNWNRHISKTSFDENAKILLKLKVKENFNFLIFLHLFILFGENFDIFLINENNNM